MKLRAFLLGVQFAWQDRGQLSTGLSWEDDEDMNEAFGYGANVGEWLWDLTHGDNAMRWPWNMRKG